MNQVKAVGARSPLVEPIRVGLVGVTGYAYAYMESLRDLERRGRISWGAVTIVNREVARDQVRFFEERQVPVYGDYEEMLAAEEGRLDWICLPTGIGWHTRMTLNCLARGLRVLVEKPLAPTLQDVEAIQRAERESGQTIGVGFQHLFLDETWQIKERLLSGEIGEIERIDCIALWPRSTAYYHRNSWGGKLHDEGSWILDSPFHNGLSHLVNLILFWAGSSLEGRADVDWASAELYRSKAIESFDTLRTEARFDTGVEAAVVMSHSSSHTIDPEIRITGSKGSFVWRFRDSHSFIVDGEGRSLQSPGLVRIRELMFESMADHLQGKPSRICTSEQAKGTCKWVNVVHDTAPIEEVPEAYRLSYVDAAGDRFEAVDHLEYFALRSYKERISFKEAGAPWAVEARSRDVSDYRGFEARFCEDPTAPSVGTAAAEAAKRTG